MGAAVNQPVHGLQYYAGFKVHHTWMTRYGANSQVAG